MECIRGQVRWSGMHARTLVSECYSQLASISHEAHHSRTRECQGEGNHQRAFRSFPQHKLREKCMQAEVCYHMRRGGRKSTKPKSSISSRFGARSPSAQRVLEAVRSRFERPFAALDRRSRSWTHRRPFASLVYVCVRWGGNPSPVVLTIIIPTQLSHTTARRRGETVRLRVPERRPPRLALGDLDTLPTCPAGPAP